MLTAHPLRAAIVTAGALTALVGTFLTWLQTGGNARSSYDLFDLVERLGFSPSGAVGLALRSWPLAPLLLVLVGVAYWVDLGRARHQAALRRGRAVLGVPTALYVGGTAAAVLSAPDIAVFDVGPGPATTLAGALVLLAGLSWRLVAGAVSATRRARSELPSAVLGDPS